MIPVLTPEEMAAVDAAALEPVDELIGRAARAVSRGALGLLGGGYGRRVVVIAGPGNNGNDGRVAAQELARRGVSTVVLDAGALPARLPECDLVIDAAFGTGFRGTFDFPHTGGTPVLAVDIPSGVAGDTGRVHGTVAHAALTVTFAALKPGLVVGDGPSHCGEIVVADIGLDTSVATAHLVEDHDLVEWVPDRATDDHKWSHAVWVVAGSPGMGGAAALCAEAALRGGSGYVRLSTPGAATPGTATPGVAAPTGPLEAVGHPLDHDDWSSSLASDAGRFSAVVVGPGLGRSDETVTEVRRVTELVNVPLVLDGDALSALGRDVAAIVSARTAPTVLTPHDGEFERLTGAAPGEDRLAAARSLARACGCVVLLKGPTTVVASAEGSVLLVRRGGPRLATAGTGDVLSGLVAAHLALGADPHRAAAAAAHLHGAAAELGPRRGLVASDLPCLVRDCWAALVDS